MKTADTGSLGELVFKILSALGATKLHDSWSLRNPRVLMSVSQLRVHLRPAALRTTATYV